MKRALSHGGNTQPLRPKLDCCGLTHPGRVRAENQDAFLVDAEAGLFIVSDGMGGGNAGELASRIVVTVLPPLIRDHLSGMEAGSASAACHQLKTAITRLSSEVRSRTTGQAGLDGMGATVVAALIRGNRVLIAHMGDSRAYRCRNGTLELLTKDHSVARVLVERGEITRSQARNHPAKDQLTRFVGMAGGPLPEVRSVELRPGDRLLLCSDGLTKMVQDAILLRTLITEPAAALVCDHLVTAANIAGGHDNISVVCVCSPIDKQAQSI